MFFISSSSATMKVLAFLVFALAVGSISAGDQVGDLVQGAIKLLPASFQNLLGILKDLNISTELIGGLLNGLTKVLKQPTLDSITKFVCRIVPFKDVILPTLDTVSATVDPASLIASLRDVLNTIKEAVKNVPGAADVISAVDVAIAELASATTIAQVKEIIGTLITTLGDKLKCNNNPPRK